MTTIEVDFVPADRNSCVATNELFSIESPLTDWQIGSPLWVNGVEFPRYVPTASKTHATHSSLDDEDVAFLDACRDRLASQLRDND